MLEEFLPLAVLANHLPGVTSARLLAANNQGPDAQVIVTDRSGSQTLAVQITVADQDEQEGLARELLSEGKPVVRNTKRVRRKDRSIDTVGRSLSTPIEDAKRHADLLVKAVERKIGKFYEGTDLLLVHIDRLQIPPANYDWKSDVADRVAALPRNPYAAVYVSRSRCSQNALLRDL